MSIPTLIIGGTEITVTRRLPASAFTASAKKALSFQRSQDGTLYSQKNYEKYSIRIRGLSQDLFEDLREEYQQDTFIDLYSIVNRKEVITAPGTTRLFLTSRRIRIDDDAAAVVVESPEDTVITGISISNPAGATQGHVLFTGATPSLDDQVVVRYYPIIEGQIVDLPSDYDWVRDEETWDLLFEEA